VPSLRAFSESEKLKPMAVRALTNTLVLAPTLPGTLPKKFRGRFEGWGDNAIIGVLAGRVNF
jgi:hypothetical protein